MLVQQAPNGGARSARHRRPVGLSLVLGALLAVSAILVVTTPSAQPVAAEPIEPISFIVNGTGNGHGRGMSQWGAYGRAVNGRQSWTTILNAYYGGTSSGTAPNSKIRVRLFGADNSTTVGVISPVGRLRWAAANASASRDYASVYVVETSPNRFDVFGMTTELACATNIQLPLPSGTYAVGSTNTTAVKQIQAFLNAYGFNAGPVDGIFGAGTKAAVERFQSARSLPTNGTWTTSERSAALALMAAGPAGSWTRLASSATGPITFTSRSASPSEAASSTLGLCGGTDGIVQYRGDIEVRDTEVGNRVINVVAVESYLRGVVPREVYASWGNSAAGMNALKAQAVAARSYALSQHRYSYADTCNTTSCQVYAGAAVRATPAGTSTVREHPNTDAAISATAGVVRRWPNGSIVATEFSDSNGPRTAGGAFPAVDDPYDAVAGNKNHTWTRTLSPGEVASAYGLSSLAAVRTERDPSTIYDGIWANRVRLTSTSTVSAWAFRNEFGLPSPGFTIKPVYPSSSTTCMPAPFDTFAMIGDSVGMQVAGSPTSSLRSRIDAAFRSESYDVLKNRATDDGSVDDGVTAAGRVQRGTEVVLVELGYNDSPKYLAARIDKLMGALRSRSVGQVLWVNLSERRPEYVQANAALDAAAAKYPNLTVLDWRSASAAHDDWFADGVHLSKAGTTGFAAFLTQQIANAAGVSSGKCLSWRSARVAAKGTIEVPGLGRSGVPNSLGQVKGVALNVTVVQPSGSGYVNVWECGQPRPSTASINFQTGNTTPNMVILPLSKTGRICVWSLTEADIVVDINGWFDSDSGLRVATGRLLDTRAGSRVEARSAIRVPIRGRLGIPKSKSGVQAVSLNLAAVEAVGAGHLTVWECGQSRPATASVNFVERRAAANAVVVPLRGSGDVCIEASTATDVVVDVTGWFDSNADIHPIEKRLHDSRQSGGRLAAGRQRQVPNRPQVRLSSGAVTGVIYNITAVRPDGYGHLRAWRCGAGKPPTAAVNFRPKMAIPNAVGLSVTANDSLCVWTTHTTDLVVDAVAAFGANAGLHAATARLADTRFAVR